MTESRKQFLFKLLALGLGVFTAMVACEAYLRVFAPRPYMSVGHIDCLNAERYGWGFAPGECFPCPDPDTGEIFFDRANNHGWRDLDRTVRRREGFRRILVLGDSVTFSLVGRGEDTYTRMLEERFRKEGRKVEVLNMAYGCFGTDQELEAFLLDGIHYRPDIVILQFCRNDIGDASWHYSEALRNSLAASRPFYYTYDDENGLRRHPNPARSGRWRWMQRIKYVATRFELSKRLYWAYLRGKQKLSGTLSPGRGVAARTGRVDTNSRSFKLFAALVGELKKATDSIHASLHILNETDEMEFRWMVEHGLLKGGPGALEDFLSLDGAIRALAAARSIGYIPLTGPVERFRNDPHPNVEGNRTLCDSMWAYLSGMDVLESPSVRTGGRGE